MLNKSGIRTEAYAAPRQILANVELQYSVGTVVAQSVGTTVNGRNIAKAGTPVVVNFNDTLVPAVNAVVEGVDQTEANAVLLHNVDVTDGNANATALIFGFVNLNRLEDDVKVLITGNKVGQVTFLNL